MVVAKQSTSDSGARLKSLIAARGFSTFTVTSGVVIFTLACFASFSTDGQITPYGSNPDLRSAFWYSCSAAKIGRHFSTSSSLPM